MRWRRRKRRRKRPESSVSDWVQGFYTEGWGGGTLGYPPGFFYHLVIIMGHGMRKPTDFMVF